MIERCDECRFWNLILRRTSTSDELMHKDDWIGECRRYPPLKVSEPIPEAEYHDGEFDFPRVEAEKWCGEFKSRVVVTDILALDGLKERDLSVLSNAGIRTVQDLMAYSYNDLMSMPNLGRLSVQRITVALAIRGKMLSGTPKSSIPGFRTKSAQKSPEPAPPDQSHP